MVFTEAEHAHWALHWIKGGVLQMGNCVFLRINEGIRINRVEEVKHEYLKSSVFIVTLFHCFSQ